MTLKTDSAYGYYPQWPEDGNDWVHPDDVALARRTIPSMRVWRREGAQGVYVVLHYGELQMRVKPTLWQEIGPVEFEVGDWVEVLSRGQLNEPRTGVVREVLWEPRSQSARYQIDDAGAPIPNLYEAADLRRVTPTLPNAEA